LSAGRSGFLLLSLLLIIFFLLTPLIPLRLLYRLIGCAVIAVGLLASLNASPLMKKRFEQAFMEAAGYEKHADSAVGVRVYIMTQSLGLIATKPILGHGTASYHNLICTVLPARKDCYVSQQHPDNQYVMFGVDHGLLGIGLFIGLMAAVLFMASKQPMDLKILMTGLALMLFFNSFLSSSLWTSRQNHFFIFMLALLSAQAFLNTNGKK
jgi:O-antigen ligase